MAIQTRGMSPLLQVFDMPISIAFYRNKIGFEVVNPSHDDVDWVLLRLNDAEVMLNTAYEKDQRPAVPDPARNAAHADTAIYFDCPHVDETYSILIRNGIELNKPIITSYGWKAIYVTDPDGYCICFHWPMQS
jgi:glyoxylase I family protein